jgi:hypothetical protein
MLGTDSSEYEILSRAAAQVINHDGLSVELGIREGGGSHYMIEQFFNSSTDKTHIGIDPYGSLPYEWKQNEIAGWVYDNTMRHNAIMNLLKITHKTNVNFIFFNFTDDIFFSKFADGVPIYIKGKEEIVNNYSIVHFDAIHSVEAITKEVNFFIPRTTKGSMFVFDDIVDFYDHSKIEEIILNAGFEVFEKGNKKASYKKAIDTIETI